MYNQNNNLINGFYLEDFDVFISWNTDKRTLIGLFNSNSYEIRENKKFNYFGISFKSKFLNSNEVALITFNFVKDILTSISVSFPLSKSDIEQSFESTQQFLEEKLGEPNNRFNVFSNILKRTNKKFKWKRKNIIIEHEMFEGFDIVEKIEIIIR